MVNVYIFDFDGTLSDPSHRRQFIQGPKKNWPMFQKQSAFDPPLPTLKIFEKIYNSFDDVWIFSGRENSVRESSVDWLLNNTNINPARRNHLNSILKMRNFRDYRDDRLIKEEMLIDLDAKYKAAEEEYKIVGVFDDRNKVVDMWRSKGLFVFDVNQTREEF